MRNVQHVAQKAVLLLVVCLVSACTSNSFDDAYSSVDLGARPIALGGVAPIPLDD